MTESVALVKYNGDFKKTLEVGIDLIEGLRTLKSPLIIKPNICTDKDRTGFAVTNVKLVEALIMLFFKKNRNLSVKIVESDSGSKYADEAFEKFGYKSLIEEMRSLGLDISLVNLSRSPTAPIKLDGLYFKNPEFPTEIIESSFFVSLAVAKTHYLSFITGTLKNLFGLIPRKDQFVYHPYINEVIVDLNRVVRPDLCIIDARVGLEGWAGPRTRRLNAFILGKNPVSVDSIMARIMGFNPEKILQLVSGEQFNLGTLKPKVFGANIDSIKVQFNPPTS